MTPPADTLDRFITITPGTCGGKPRIAGRRIKVQHVAVWHERMGMTADEIASEFDLSLCEIYAALAYYFDDREQIDADMAADRAYADEFRRTSPSVIAETPGDD